jgi:hypothetical protein
LVSHQSTIHHLHISSMSSDTAAALRCIPGAIAVVQGPAGTGKTTWAGRISIPLLANDNRGTTNRHQILFTSTTNEVVKDTALKLDAMLKEELPDRRCIVVRLHAVDTEEKAAWAPAREHQDTIHMYTALLMILP